MITRLQSESGGNAQVEVGTGVAVRIAEGVHAPEVDGVRSAAKLRPTAHNLVFDEIYVQ